MCLVLFVVYFVLLSEVQKHQFLRENYEVTTVEPNVAEEASFCIPSI